MMTFLTGPASSPLVLLQLFAIVLLSVLFLSSSSAEAFVSSSSLRLRRNNNNKNNGAYINNHQQSQSQQQQPYLFLHQPSTCRRHNRSHRRSPLIRCFASTNDNNNYNDKKARKLTDLPVGISPFEKSWTKNVDVPGQLRKLALLALRRATDDKPTKEQEQGSSRRQCQSLPLLLEIDFPPLLGEGKTQFDDFDNIQELDKNRDWCVEWLPMLFTSSSSSSSSWSLFNNKKKTNNNNSNQNDNIWLILPDEKEVQLCKEEWPGQRYRNAARFTTIERVTKEYTTSATGSGSDTGGSTSSSTTGNEAYAKPWGTSLAEAVQSVVNRDGNDVTTDDSTSSPFSSSPPSIHIICQPGNGGPVEDWINCKTLVESCPSSSTTTSSTTFVIVNGALDKVRDGFYPAIFFPQLAQTVDFYKQFDALLVLKPVSDKGVYGWIYRIYPEPWQVVLQTVMTRTTKNNGRTNNVNNEQQESTFVENKVVYVSETRPTYAEAVAQLVQGARRMAMAAVDEEGKSQAQ